MIREYRESDWVAVRNLFDRSKPIELGTGDVGASFFRLSEDTERTVGFLKNRVFVFEDAGHLLGFVGHDGDYIDWLFLEPDAFRHGIGRALLRHCLAQISGEAWLVSMKGNHSAISLYLSEGFQIVEERETENGGLACTAVKLQKKSRIKSPDQGGWASRNS